MQALFNSSHRNRLHWVVFRIWQSKDLTESKYRTGFRAADSSPRCVTCVTCVTHAGIAKYCHLCCLDSTMRPGKLRRWCLWSELWIWIPIVGRWTEPQKIHVEQLSHRSHSLKPLTQAMPTLSCARRFPLKSGKQLEKPMIDGCLGTNMGRKNEKNHKVIKHKHIHITFIHIIPYPALSNQPSEPNSAPPAKIEQEPAGGMVLGTRQQCVSNL